MKNTIIAMFLIAIAPVVSNAGPYFRLIDFKHPQVSAGVFKSMVDGGSDAGSSVALITHSPADGCIVKEYCVDWTPLAIGGTFGKGLGGPSVSIGSSINLLPQAKKLLLGLLKGISSESQFSNVKELLAPALLSAPDFTFAIGPNWSYVFPKGQGPKGQVTVFMGAAWKF